MPNKLVGKFYERRGDDHFTVNTSPDGDVVQIVQRDAIRLTHYSINFWAEDAPHLIGLIEKAAGVEPEYEYTTKSVSPSGEEFVFMDWSTLKNAKSDLEWYQNRRSIPKREGFQYSLVRRRKAGPEEDVE